jgi:hypothetical protein
MRGNSYVRFYGKEAVMLLTYSTVTENAQTWLSQVKRPLKFRVKQY